MTLLFKLQYGQCDNYMLGTSHGMLLSELPKACLEAAQSCDLLLTECARPDLEDLLKLKASCDNEQTFYEPGARAVWVNNLEAIDAELLRAFLDLQLQEAYQYALNFDIHSSINEGDSRCISLR